MQGQQADAVADGGHGLPGHSAGAGGAVREHPVQAGLIGQDLLGLLPDRREGRHHHLGQVLFERAVAGPGVLGLQGGDRLAGQRRVDPQQVGHARLGLGVGPHLCARVGDRAGDLLADLARLVEDVDDALRGGGRLAHLGRRVLQVVDLGHLGQDVGLRRHERLAVPVVESLGQRPAQFQVLPLVLADRHLVGLIEQDVRGLQDRVGEQADRGLLLALLGRLVLELGHPAGFAEPGHAAERPGQLGVLGHVALHEQRAPVRVQPGAEQLGGGDPGPPGEQGRVLRHR